MTSICRTSISLNVLERKQTLPSRRTVICSAYTHKYDNNPRGFYLQSLRSVNCCSGVYSTEHSETKKRTSPEAFSGVKDVLESDIDQALQETAESLIAKLHGTNVFLVGMMGCGKSTVGRILSDALGYAFFDSDTMIEKAMGTSVSAIFQDQGEPAFRELECQAIQQLSSMEGLIVATGGGVILKDQNWRNMRTGTSVWIDVPLEDLAMRVVSAGIGSRPILSEGTSLEMDLFTQALNKLTSVFSKRENLYRKSDVRVSLGDLASQLGIQVSDLQPKMIALQILISLETHLKQKALEDTAVVGSSEFHSIQEVPVDLELTQCDPSRPQQQEIISSQ